MRGRRHQALLAPGRPTAGVKDAELESLTPFRDDEVGPMGWASGANRMQPHQQNLVEPVPSPLLAQSIDAFYRNLPELLKKHYGKWVAYHGDEFLGVGRRQTHLYQKCLRRGLKAEEFIVLFADNQALSDQEEIDLPWPQ